MGFGGSVILTSLNELEKHFPLLYFLEEFVGIQKVYFEQPLLETRKPLLK
ncbi:hypothetical protein PRBEI_2001804100 [Prionailurus iriomotensis]